MDKLPLFLTVQRTSGKGRGKQMDIPTINFVIPSGLNISQGIYAGYVINDSKKYQAAIHFGPRPQFNESDPSLEAYILEGIIKIDSGDIQLVVVKYVRKIYTFPTIEDMLTQIEVDIKTIKAYLIGN